MARMANRLAAATGLCACLAGICAAQPAEYPTRPVRLLVGFAAAGGIDPVARPIAQKLSAIFRHQVIIDNRPGAAGTIAAEIAARAQPDGHTILFIVPAFAINAGLQTKLSFDPIADFAGVTQIADANNVLSVHPAVAAHSVKELVALAKTKPLNFGSSGIGTIGHLAGELFNEMTGTRITHVAYKGGGPAMVDLVAGHIQMIFASPGTVVPQVKAGRIRALAVTTATRAAALPDTPTIAESGVPGYEAKNWYGLLVPARTPVAIVQRLSTEVRGVLGMPDIRATLIAQAVDPVPSTPEQFSAFVKAEIAKWARVVKAAGIKSE